MKSKTKDKGEKIKVIFFDYSDAFLTIYYITVTRIVTVKKFIINYTIVKLLTV